MFTRLQGESACQVTEVCTRTQVSRILALPTRDQPPALQVRMGAMVTALSRTYGEALSRTSYMFGLFGGRQVYSLPPHLLPLALTLYHLHRGPMLGQVVGHSDEHAHLFQLFLKADYPLAKCMLMPRLFQVRTSRSTFCSICVRSVCSSSCCSVQLHAVHIVYCVDPCWRSLSPSA